MFEINLEKQLYLNITLVCIGFLRGTIMYLVILGHVALLYIISGNKTEKQKEERTKEAEENITTTVNSVRDNVTSWIYFFSSGLNKPNNTVEDAT